MRFDRRNSSQHADFCLCIDDIIKLGLGVVNNFLKFSFGVRAGDSFSFQQQIAHLVSVRLDNLRLKRFFFCGNFFFIQRLHCFITQHFCFFFSSSLNALDLAFFALDAFAAKLVFPEVFQLLCFCFSNFFKLCCAFLSGFKRSPLCVSVFLSLLVSKWV